MTSSTGQDLSGAEFRNVNLVAARMRGVLLLDSPATATQHDLDRVRDPNPPPGFPPAGARTAVSRPHVLLNEESTQHRLALRDLASIEADPAD